MNKTDLISGPHSGEITPVSGKETSEDDTFIHHFTKRLFLPSFFDSGVVQLESMSCGGVRRFVWFTEAEHCKSAIPVVSGDCGRDIRPVRLTFIAREVGAKPWNMVRRRFRNSKRAARVVNSLDDLAREAGDDPSDYWVCEKPVDFGLCINRVEVAVLADDPSTEQQPFQSP